ncbi:DUF3995 domain-containing protein [Tenacibaculum crassostreae]|uniref:DUF3995 domain-containing protein n=1 Tax=Tenacibaculum crassostreae TaxID=502683 RepID=UPI003892CDFF
MVYFLGVICVILLFFISLIHIYWAFGGTLWVDAVIPTKKADEKAMSPPKFLTFLVALLLGCFALIYAEKIELFRLSYFSDWIKDCGIHFVASIFILRAIGEFNYVGFFKKIRTTQFAKNDTNYFSPLCLFLGVVGLLIGMVL